MNLKDDVNRLASQCVKCALCLPHCPTYQLTQDENESPRGRIALFQAYAKEQLALDPHGKAHLDQCLGCRACERVCPAHVEYGELLTLGRAMLKTTKGAQSLPKAPLSTLLMSWMVKHPAWQRLLQQLIWLSQKWGLRQMATTLGIPKLLGLGSLNRLLPSVPKPLTWQTVYPAIGEKQGSVLFFTGCMSNWCDQETVLASIHVLQHLGYEVNLPTKQACCGAIALHAGDLNDALTLAEENLNAFLPDIHNMSAVITVATGCSAVLGEYHKHFSLLATKDEKWSLFANKVTDIINFIQSVKWPEQLALKPLPLKVFLHTPCTLRNVLKTPFAPLQMLARIPELVCQTINSPHCCGAAGTYMLDHPEIAKPLLNNLLSELKEEPANFIATSNVGCALHIQQQMRESNSAIRVTHPVTLLARALGF